MKRILITGADSYIGMSFEKWVAQWPDEYHVDTVDMIGDAWREKDFSGYDVVFHVAGIAHVSRNPKLKDLYYKVNRDLTIEAAEKAKSEGVKQFIFMSSIIVYGSKISYITKDTKPNPDNFYGDSKLKAEEGILPLQSDEFKVVVLRPPMIYGPGSKGNFPKLVKLAKKLPIFPDFDNQRSMLFINNLCEFIRLMITNNEQGLFFPQNEEYVRTSEMVELIAGMQGKKIILTKVLNPVLRLMRLRVGLINKVLGDLVYEKDLSDYKIIYQITTLSDSIKFTKPEGGK